MTLLLSSPARSLIADVLRQSAGSVREQRDGRWAFVLPGVLPSLASAQLADSFLQFDAPAPAECVLADAPHWLRWNASLAGTAKIALVANPWRVRLRAEVALEEDAALGARVAESLLGLQAACRLLAHHGAGEAVAHPAQASPADSPASTPRLFALLRELGRTFTERSAQVASVELPVRGGSCRVVLEEASAGLRASAEFLRVPSLDGTCPLAVAVLLLCAGGALRLARPFAVDAGDQLACGFEVRFGGETTAGELEHGLEALAVAAWTCKEEAPCLLDNALGASYFALRTFPPTLAREEFLHG